MKDGNLQLNCVIPSGIVNCFKLVPLNDSMSILINDDGN